MDVLIKREKALKEARKQDEEIPVVNPNAGKLDTIDLSNNTQQ